MFFLIVVWGAIATLAGLVTNSKGRGWGEGIVLGGLLGIFGLIIVAFFKPITTPLPPSITLGPPVPTPAGIRTVRVGCGGGMVQPGRIPRLHRHIDLELPLRLSAKWFNQEPVEVGAS
jgi:hypothetical protein